MIKLNYVLLFTRHNESTVVTTLNLDANLTGVSMRFERDANLRVSPARTWHSSTMAPIAVFILTIHLITT